MSVLLSTLSNTFPFPSLPFPSLLPPPYPSFVTNVNLFRLRFRGCAFPSAFVAGVRAFQTVSGNGAGGRDGRRADQAVDQPVPRRPIVQVCCVVLCCVVLCCVVCCVMCVVLCCVVLLCCVVVLF